MVLANKLIIGVIALYGLIVLVPYVLFCKMGILSNFKMKISKESKPNNQDMVSTITSFIILYICFLTGDYLKSLGMIKFHSLSTLGTIVSCIAIVLIHDAYFYWTHFLMHKSKFFFQFHKHHHQNHAATPLDVLAFHPVEALIHFIFFVIYPIIIPTNMFVLEFMFIWMLVCNSAGHLEYEFYPKFLYDVPLIRQCNAAVHHQMHHRYYNSNFSIYYNWWDRWMKTNHQEYFTTYKKVKASQEAFKNEVSSPVTHSSL